MVKTMVKLMQQNRCEHAQKELAKLRVVEALGDYVREHPEKALQKTQPEPNQKQPAWRFLFCVFLVGAAEAAFTIHETELEAFRTSVIHRARLVAAWALFESYMGIVGISDLKWTHNLKQANQILVNLFNTVIISNAKSGRHVMPS